MSIKSFFSTHAGRATVAVCLAALSLACPLVATWLVAGGILAFAVYEFRMSFRLLDEAEKTATTVRPIKRPAGTALAVVKRSHLAPPCDVEAVLAAIAEQPLSP